MILFTRVILKGVMKSMNNCKDNCKEIIMVGVGILCVVQTISIVLKIIEKKKSVTLVSDTKLPKNYGEAISYNSGVDYA